MTTPRDNKYMINPVLDNGYVEFIEAWGTGKGGTVFEDHVPVHRDCEVGIIEAARQSTQGSFRGWEQDQKLLHFLMDNNHATPFEFSGMVIEVQAPIFVFREWHRHRTQSYNEMSARYSPLPDLYYVPTVERVMMGGGNNKQAQGVGGKELAELDAKKFIEVLENDYKACEFSYKAFLDAGVPKELARCIMPVGHYSRMRASANLRNWLAFITLRADPKAQWEIQQYAFAVANFVRRTFPHTYTRYLENAG